MMGLSIGHILVVLLVVILVFGTKKLGNIGADLGQAIKGFRKAMADPDDARAQADDASIGSPSSQFASSETRQTTTHSPASGSSAVPPR